MTALPTTAQERLERVRADLSGARTDSRAQRRLRLGRSQNLLTGVMLRAAERQEAGLGLTGLEERLLGALRAVLPREEVADFGRAYREATQKGVVEWLPETFTARSAQDGYAMADLVRDMAAGSKEILAQPNVSVVNVADLGEEDSFDSQEFTAAMTEYGTGATVVTAPAGPETDSAQAVYAQLRATKFHCVRGTGDTFFGPRDEIYWVAGSGSDSREKMTYSSAEYGSIEAGVTRWFPGDAILFRGEVTKALFANIECWERDEGGIWEELKNTLFKVAETCVDAAVDITENGESQDAGLAVIVALVAALLGALLAWLINDDDLIGERTIAFDRAALAALAARPNSENYWSFNGIGHCQLYLRHENPALKYTKLTGSTWSSPAPVADRMSAVGPGVAVHGGDGKLYSTFRGLGNTNLYVTTLTGTSWSPAARLSNCNSLDAPALAYYNGKLYCVFRGANGDEHLYYSVLNDGRWSNATKFGAHTSAAGPALAVHNNKLYCMHRGGGNDQSLWDTTFDGTRWSPDAELRHQRSATGPALAVLNGTLHCVHRGANSDDQHLWHFYLGSNGNWTTDIQISPNSHRSAPGPALAAHDGKLYCVHRGSTDNTALYVTAFDGNAWGPDTKIGTQTTASNPALAVHSNSLYAFYRG